MARYQVLITMNEFREIDADSAQHAEEVAQQLYMDGMIELNSMPEFVCEECDFIEEEMKNA